MWTVLMLAVPTGAFIALASLLWSFMRAAAKRFDPDGRRPTGYLGGVSATSSVAVSADHNEGWPGPKRLWHEGSIERHFAEVVTQVEELLRSPRAARLDNSDLDLAKASQQVKHQ